MNAIRLTPLGEQMVEDVGMRPGPKKAILSTLYDNGGGPMDVGEVVQQAHINEELGLEAVQSLIAKEYVKEL